MELKTVMRPKESASELNKFCQFIKQYIGETPTVVEIGSFMGESAKILASNFPNGVIYCIDPWLPGYDNKDSASDFDFSDVENQFDLRTRNYTNIIKKKGLSTDFKIECDVVYIDGCHKYECVKEDILHWLPLTKKVICGHDYHSDDKVLELHPHIAGVKKAVNEILKTPDKVFADGSWVKILKTN